VGVVDESGALGRRPDIWVRPTLIERLDLEIKTPLRLRAPVTPPSEEEAIEIVLRSMRKAAGQLSPDHSGIVAIGAFHLEEEGLNVLARATQRVLTQQRQMRRHVAAVLLFTVGHRLTREVNAAGAVVRTLFVPIMEHRLVYHPGYSGTLRVSETRPWSIWDRGPEL
jgi:hypothetical protein